MNKVDRVAMMESRYEQVRDLANPLIDTRAAAAGDVTVKLPAVQALAVLAAIGHHATTVGDAYAALADDQDEIPDLWDHLLDAGVAFITAFAVDAMPDTVPDWL